MTRRHIFHVFPLFASTTTAFLRPLSITHKSHTLSAPSSGTTTKVKRDGILHLDRIDDNANAEPSQASVALGFTEPSSFYSSPSSASPELGNLLDSRSASQGEGLFGGPSLISSFNEPTLSDAVEEILFVDGVPATASTEDRESVSAVLAASQEAVIEAIASQPSLFSADDIIAPDEKIASEFFTPEVDASLAGPANNGLVEPGEVGDGEAVSAIAAPGVVKILKFAVPAMGVWLCGPLLSLIDTSAVGVLSGTAQQAALNPAVAVTDYAALLIAFLYTGSTNLIAAAKEKDRGVEGSPRTSKAMIGGLQLSGYVGLGLGLFLFVFARQLLRALIGNDGISPTVFCAAMKYVRIRALGMPAAAVIGSAQSASLGMQDIRSPLYVLVAAAVVNFLGDMIFVGSSHPLIGGAAGAAWATVFSQYAAMGLFVYWLCNKPRKQPIEEGTVLNLSKNIMELTGGDGKPGVGRRRRFRKSLTKSNMSRPRSEDDGTSVRGFLQGQFRARDLVGLPTKQTLRDFGEYVLPVTSTQLGRVSAFVAMSHVVSSSLGTISMAAQQVIVSFFYCLCPIADSLNLTAQSFVPAIFEKRKSIERAKALRKTSKNFLKAGAVFGMSLVGAVGCIPLLSGFFTADPSVVSLVNVVSPLLVGVFAVHGLVCASEGLLLGQKDLGYLGKMYGGFFFLVPYLMMRVKRAAISGVQVDLTSVWKVFLSYQLLRCVGWVARVLVIQRRTDRDAQTLGQAPSA